MAIQFQVASSLSVISEALIRDLKDDSFSVFDKQFVITQTYGVNNWLRQQLAIRAGIAAGLRFNKMNDILELLYRWLCNERHNLIDKDSMTWAIFSELNEPEFCHNYPGIATYYEGNESKRADVSSFNTPGMSRPTVSTNTAAANSPPERT